MVFGNNTASEISKLLKIPRVPKQRAREWYLENFEILRAGIIAKYHVQVTLSFVSNGSWEIFGDAKETFISLRLKEQTQSATVTIFLRQWKKKWSGFCETGTKCWRHTTRKSSMKVILNHSFCSLQRQNGTSNKTLRVLVSFFQRLIAALLKNSNWTPAP